LGRKGEVYRKRQEWAAVCVLQKQPMTKDMCPTESEGIKTRKGKTDGGNKSKNGDDSPEKGCAHFVLMVVRASWCYTGVDGEGGRLLD